jgi:hypothetical protein
VPGRAPEPLNKKPILISLGFFIQSVKLPAAIGNQPKNQLTRCDLIGLVDDEICRRRWIG